MQFRVWRVVELLGSHGVVDAERLCPGDGLATVWARDGPLVQRIGTRADVQPVEYIAQLGRRNHRGLRRLGCGRIRRMAVRVLRAGGNRSSGGGIFVFPSARQAGVGGFAAGRSVSQRFPSDH